MQVDKTRRLEMLHRADWRSWATLIWVVSMGVLYVNTVLRCRAPGLWQWIHGFVAR